MGKLNLKQARVLSDLLEVACEAIDDAYSDKTLRELDHVPTVLLRAIALLMDADIAPHDSAVDMLRRLHRLGLIEL